MSQDSVQFTIAQGDTSVLVRLHHARITQIDEVESLNRALDPIVAGLDNAQFHFDFQDVQYITSGIIGWLAAMALRIKGKGGVVHLYHLTPEMDQLLRQVGMHKQMTLHPQQEPPPSLESI